MHVKQIWSVSAVLLIFVISGCAGLGTKRSSDASPTLPDDANNGATVTVTPASVTIRAGANESFAATTSGANKNFVWSVNSVTGGNSTTGTIDTNGMYTAPANLPTPNTVTVTAVNMSDSSQRASSTVTLQNPIPVLSAAAPTSIPAGSFGLTLTGRGFLKNSAVSFGGQMLATTYVSPTTLEVSGTATPAQIGTVNVEVQNPDPGAAMSSSVTVSVVTAPPQQASQPTPQPVSQTAAVRFLEQSTFGPTPSLVSQVAQNGFDYFLQSQFSATASTYPAPAAGATDITPVQNQFFINAVNDNDQLRQRVAFALNEIWVVSINKVPDPTGYTNYMKALTNDALGNYYNIMKDVTLTPAMGHYLDMVDNAKPAPGQHANENYARESMQLFTLGLNVLNQDGTPQVDGSGNPVPTYTQNDVMSLGRSFTGWTFPTEPGASLARYNPEYYGGNMVPFESNHDSGAKTFLGQSVPAGQSAEQELDTVLTIIFNHPNLPPFVSQQLIEKLVTSNPSPAYVSRVASAFTSGKFQTYGTGKRGDMQATVAAILLDSEARRGDSASTAASTDGKLREPVVMMVSVARLFSPTTDGTGFTNFGGNMSQSLFNSGSVFNFFPPQNLIAGTTLNGPEFAIYNTNTALARVNFVNTVVNGSISSATKLNFATVYNAGSQDAMVDWLNNYLLHGTMSSQMKQSVLTAMTAAGTNTQNQAKAALYLVMSSSQYQVQR